MKYPQKLNLSDVTEGRGTNFYEEAKGDSPYPYAGTLYNILYSNTDNPKGINVCTNFDCATNKNLGKGANKVVYDTKDTSFCINPDVQKKLNTKYPDMCPTNDDLCYGNCNILYDTMVKTAATKADTYGMNGVDTILNYIDTNTTKPEVTKQQYIL